MLGILGSKKLGNRGFPTLGKLGFHPLDDLGEPDFEDLRQFDDSPDRGAFDASLNQAHVGPVKASIQCQLLLGEFTLPPYLPQGLPELPGSMAAFREIFLNLILNALQAGGEGMHLWLQAWEGVLEDGSERFVLLVVEDDGPGIPAVIQEKVFAPFYTTKQQGTGLGLAIVRRDIDHMGGRITLESPARAGHGTRFLIHLPLQ